MKKKSMLFIMAAVMLLGTSAMAQRVKTVPAPVAAALKSKYPQAIKVTWEKEKGNFEANWGGRSGEDMSVMFTPTGTFVEQVEATRPVALPAMANTYIKTHYAGKKVTEAGKVTDAVGKITYEAEIKGMEVVFDDKGKFIKAGKEND